MIRANICATMSISGISGVYFIDCQTSIYSYDGYTFKFYKPKTLNSDILSIVLQNVTIVP